MKGRNGSTGIETGHDIPGQLRGAGQGRGRKSSSRAHSRFRRQARGRLVVAIAGSGIALLLGIFFLTYGSKAYENWRARRLLHEATALSQTGNFTKAAQIAQELAHRNPDSLGALAILADTAEKQNLEEALAWRERIARLLPKDPESQLNFASAALRFGKLDLAREALNRVSQEDRDSAAFHVVAGWLARAEGNLAEQEEQFAAAVNREPKNDLYQFNLAALQIRSKDAKKSKNARDTLERLSGVAPYRTGALRALLNDAVDRSDLPAADGFAQQLQMSPEVTFGDYLLCLNFYRKLDEKKFRQLLEKVKPFAARNASDLTSLIEWMNQNALAGDVVKWVDKLATASPSGGGLPAARLSSPPASVAVANAYATVKNWSRLKRWTHTGNWGDAEYLRVGYEAIAERQLHSGSGSKENPEFQKLWQSANESARSEPERELTLARLATKWQLSSQAEELWVRVAENATMRREALDNLRQLYRAKDKTTKLYEVLQQLHENSPNEAAIAADLARLGLDLGENTEQSHQLAKEAYDRAPNDTNCAVTYAFSLHRLGRNAEALAIIQSLSPDQMHDPRAAVYVAPVLVEGNELDEAKDYIHAAEKGKLYPEQKTLVEETKAKLVAASAIPSPAESPSPSATPPL